MLYSINVVYFALLHSNFKEMIKKWINKPRPEERELCKFNFSGERCCL